MTAKSLLASVFALAISALLSQAQERADGPKDWRRPCLTPKKYRIGALDPRFGISREDFQRHVEQAGDLWGAAAGRKLFSHDARGTLEIDLVYDSRQETTQHLTAARAAITEKVKAADLIRDRLLPLQARFHTLDESFSGQLSTYNRHLEDHNRIVAELNGRGGAPEGEYQTMESEKLALRKEEEALKAKRLELNGLVDQINELVKSHNGLLDRANADADALNRSGAVGSQFEEGHYARRDDEERIEIYEYDGETALVAILAHEMGHALGIRHNGDPASIMSPLVHTRTLALTAEDLEGLRAACFPR